MSTHRSTLTATALWLLAAAFAPVAAQPEDNAEAEVPEATADESAEQAQASESAEAPPEAESGNAAPSAGDEPGAAATAAADTPAAAGFQWPADDGAPAQANESPAPPASAAAADPAAAATDAAPAAAGSEPYAAVIAVPEAAPPPPAPVEPAAPAGLDEIVVTAQKTQQTLRDVPISVTVLNEKFITQQGITDLTKAAPFIPNVSVDANSFLIDVRMRGFGTHETNKAFEPTVGLVVDGIPYSRSQYFQMGLFDLQRIEALHGPQGTLFGKNNPAGLFNLSTNLPTADWEGYLQSGLGQLGGQRAEAALGGPLIEDAVNFRAAFTKESRNGFVDNSAFGKYPDLNDVSNGVDRLAGRIKLGFPDLFGGSLQLSYERAEIEFRGTGTEIDTVSQAVQALLRQRDPDIDFEINQRGSVDTPERSLRTIDTAVVSADWDLTNVGLPGWGLTLAGGWSTLYVLDSLDADQSPMTALGVDTHDKNPQTTLELRVASPEVPGLLGLESLFGADLGRSEMIAGLFGQRREITDSALSIWTNAAQLAALLAAQNAPVDPPVPPLPLPGPGTGGNERTDQTTMYFGQGSDAYAAFGQVTWHFADAWKLLLGARLGRETKTANWNRVFDQGSGAIWMAAFGGEEFTATMERSENEFSPKATLIHDLTDDINVYGGWAKGQRSGGFNEFASSADPAGLTYKAEHLDAFEIGSKMRLLGGAASFNIAAFWMDLKDFQVLTADSQTQISVVKNAGHARARGIEADGRWQATDWLSLIGAVGYNDTRYLEFREGQCRAGESDTDGDGNPRCDVSGKRFQRTPLVTGSLASSLDVPVGDALTLVGGLAAKYQSDYTTSESLDERLTQKAHTKLDAYLGIANHVQGWSVRVVGTNLTDSITFVRATDNLGPNGYYYRITEPPRLVATEFRYEF
ncbi:MAG: TonB-dependent receptor [Sinimarinibacterium sp.]